MSSTLLILHGDLECEPLESQTHLPESAEKVHIYEPQCSNLLLLTKVLLCFLFSVVVVSLLLYGIPCSLYHHQNVEYSQSISKIDSLFRSKYSPINHDIHGRYQVFDSQADKNDGMGEPHPEVVNAMDLYHNQDTFVDLSNDRILVFPNVVSDESWGMNSHKLSTKVELEEIQTVGTNGEKIIVYQKIFQDLMDEGLLHVRDEALCLGARTGEELIALKLKELQDVVGITDLASRYHVISRGSNNIFTQMLADEKFDFVFTTLFDEVPRPDLFVAEIERVLKSGGIAAMHVSLDVWHNKFLSNKGGHSIKPVTLLFHHSNIVYVARADALGLDTIIVFKKNTLGSHEDEKAKLLASGTIWPSASIMNNKHDWYLELGKSGGGLDHGRVETDLDLKSALHASKDLFQVTTGASSWIRTRVNLMIEKALSGGQSDYHNRIPSTNSGFTAMLESNIVPDDFLVLMVDLQHVPDLELVSKLVENGSIYLIDKLFLVCDHSNAEQGNQEKRIKREMMAYLNTLGTAEVSINCG